MAATSNALSEEDATTPQVTSREPTTPRDSEMLHPRRSMLVPDHGQSKLFSAPFCGPLVVDNCNSDARDHCANERTFLSYLRLSVYMCVVSVAIVVSFHLKSEPSELELRMAKPLGILFWLLSLACLCLGIGNYAKTMDKYSRRMAIVQTGWKTQLTLTSIALAIICVCVVFLFTKSQT